MIEVEFQKQFMRMIETFGNRAFPPERTKLIWNQVCDMDVQWFTRLCDRMIGDMRNPPLVSEFREAAYKERQSKFNRETDQAAKAWDCGEFNGLSKYLESIGAKSLMHAVEMEREIERGLEAEKPMSADKQRELAKQITELSQRNIE